MQDSRKPLKNPIKKKKQKRNGVRGWGRKKKSNPITDLGMP